MASIISASTTSGTALNMSADTTGVLQLATGATPTTAVTIDTSQNVGIGTTSPTDSDSFGRTIDAVGTNGAAYYTRYSGNTANFGFYGTSVNGTYLGQGGALPVIFYTTNTERMRIDSSGNCFWNGTSIIENTKYNFYFTSSTNGIGSKTDTTSTSYHVRWWNPNGVVGGIYTNGSNTTYTTSSDYRLKENIVPMIGALDKVLQLKPVTYTWKVDSTNGQGFIAHELQEIIPDCVGGEKDAVDAEGKPVYQGVDTSYLVATLTAAIQEQQTIINDLKARIETLESK